MAVVDCIGAPSSLRRFASGSGTPRPRLRPVADGPKATADGRCRSRTTPSAGAGIGRSWIGEFRQFNDLKARLVSPLHIGASAVCSLAVAPHLAVMGFARSTRREPAAVKEMMKTDGASQNTFLQLLSGSDYPAARVPQKYSPARVPMDRHGSYLQYYPPLINGTTFTPAALPTLTARKSDSEPVKICTGRSGEFWAAINIVVLRADEGEVRCEHGCSTGKLRARETEDPRENPPTNGIVRHDSHMRKSGSVPAENETRFAQVGGEY
ncbi:hypothetical protein PR048_007937 [Dryococelus australis]|uniref:Uncharacterized protein n=1 Tax=Dryococelus australis TaxID=614101 RepID=A0ABQ9HVP0_9NEOP|nr:hypothetical protein PR048_007937 [Dryococelus australis]